jgi:hypothetical protein
MKGNRVSHAITAKQIGAIANKRGKLVKLSQAFCFDHPTCSALQKWIQYLPSEIEVMCYNTVVRSEVCADSVELQRQDSLNPYLGKAGPPHTAPPLDVQYRPPCTEPSPNEHLLTTRSSHDRTTTNDFDRPLHAGLPAMRRSPQG